MGTNLEISLCMIVKNEDKVLDGCLKHIHKHVDEIIIVDTGSTDGTIEIAKKYTDKIYGFEWNDDFSAARNFSLQFASKEWILVQDADEFIQNAYKLRDFLLNTDCDCVALSKINTYIDYKLLTDLFEAEDLSKLDTLLQDGYSTSQEKILRNHCGLKYTGRVHERVFYEDLTRPEFTSFPDRLIHLMNLHTKDYKSSFYNSIGKQALYDGDDNVNLLVRHLLYSLETDNTSEFYDLFDYFSKKIKFESRMSFLLPEFDKYLGKTTDVCKKRFLDWVSMKEI